RFKCDWSSDVCSSDLPVITAHVSEWQPATFTGVSTQFVIVLLAAVTAMGFAYGRGYRPPLFMVAITCTLAAAGAHAVRYQVWFEIGRASGRGRGGSGG